MSLLNDVLRDLSNSKSAFSGTDEHGDVLLQSVLVAKKKRESYLVMAVVFVVVFLVVISGIYTTKKLTTDKTKAASQEDISGSKNLNFIDANRVNAEQQASINSSQSSGVIEKENLNAKPEMKNYIADLLQQAGRALSMDRLTSPVEDNAYGYFQKVLSLDKDNNDAKEGLDKIAERFLNKAQEQINQGNRQQADALIQRARFISSRYVQAHEISVDEIESQNSSREKTFEPAQLPEDGKDKSFVTQSSTKAPAETIKPFVLAEANSVAVSPNAGWKDEQMAQHAREMVRQGKLIEAQTQLKNFISVEKKPALSVETLADIYFQQSNTQAVEVLLEKSDYLPTDVKTKINAQVSVALGDDAQAITMLEKNLASAESNEAYRSLLASLYHKTANYQKSVVNYQRLLETFGEKPAYWLGLALAYDGLVQHKSALEAYQHLREFPQLQEQVKKYTDQRIAALRSE